MTIETGIASTKTPGFYVNVQKGTTLAPAACGKSLLIGPAILGSGVGEGSATECVVTRVTSVSEGTSLIGEGSFLESMIKHFYLNNPNGDLCVLPVADAAGAIAATGDITFTGTATEAGGIYLDIAAVGTIVAAVNVGDTETDVALAVADVINNDADQLVSAVAVAGVLTITANNAGTLGNDLEVVLNPDGQLGNQAVPTGLTAVADAFLANGAIDPDLETCLEALGSCRFDCVGSAFSDLTNLGYYDNVWNNTSGRWSYGQALFGHVFTASPRDTHGNLLAIGSAQNNEHLTITYSNCTDSPSFDISAAWTAVACRELCLDPARPLQSVDLLGIGCVSDCASPSCFNANEIELLLCNGVATHQCGAGGNVQIQRSITTYLLDQYGNPCDIWRDVETLYTVMYMARLMSNFVESEYGRVKLFNNGTDLRKKKNSVTSNLVKAELVSFFQQNFEGVVADAIDDFAEVINIARDTENNPSGDANRLNICFTPDLANQLRVIAVKFAPVLQLQQ